MNRQKKLENIISALQELDIIINQLKKHLSSNDINLKIPEIEIDLALDKTRKLYNELLFINNFETEIREKTEPVNENLAYRQAGNQKNIPVKEKIQINEEKIAEPVVPEIKQEKTVQNKTLINDDLSLQKMESIIDVIFKQNKTEDFASKLQQKPIADINEAIGLGEKMLYINELFDKNPAKYTDSVKELNNFNCLDDAMSYINSNFSWNTEKEAVISFLEIVKRKFLE